LNLVVNAIDAMFMGGILTIKTDCMKIDGQRTVVVQISDTGQGISPEHMANIFDAFFTTKSDKSGTGLGLSVSKQIVENHHGKITVDSIVGKGTTFTLFLPSSLSEKGATADDPA